MLRESRIEPRATCQSQVQRATAEPPLNTLDPKASAGGKGGILTSVGWQVTLRDPIWHMSFQ